MPHRTIVAAVVLLTLPVVATGESEDTTSRIAELERLVAQLRAERGQTWLNERRAAEVKALVRDVLADADTRAALIDDGLTAGHNGRHFYIGSADGRYLLRVSGQIQSRYIFNRADRAIVSDEEEPVTFGPGRTVDLPDETEGDRNVAGFQLRRTKLRFDGHVLNPRFTYALQLSGHFAASDDQFLFEPGSLFVTDPDGSVAFASGLPNLGAPNGTHGGDVLIEDAWIGHAFSDRLRVRTGQFKAPFLREEAVDSSRQLAVERSMIADYMTIDRTQGVELQWRDKALPLRVTAMLHDGTYAAGADFNRDMTEFAVAARAEWLAMGSWQQFDDFLAWSNDGRGLLFGAAVDWEMGERGRRPIITHFNDDINESYIRGAYDVLKWTADVSYENPDLMGLSVFAAVMGQHLENHGDTFLPNGDAHQLGAVVQAGVFLLPDKLNVYARYEWLDLDDLAYVVVPGEGHYTYPLGNPFDNQLNVITLGGNYFMSGHAAKLTLDAVWSLNSLPFNATGGGLRSDAGDGQIAVRSQLQLLF